MTEQQTTAIEALVRRFNSDMASTDLVLPVPGYPSVFGLPDGWVSVVVLRKGDRVAEATRANVLVVAGVSPEGMVCT